MKIKEIELTPEEIDYLLRGNIHWDDLQEKNAQKVRKPIGSIPFKEIRKEPPKGESISINEPLKKASINSNETFNLGRIKESFLIREVDEIKDFRDIKESKEIKKIKKNEEVKESREAKEIKGSNGIDIKEVNEIKEVKEIEKIKEIAALKGSDEIAKIDVIKEVKEKETAEELPSLTNSSNNFQRYIECTDQDTLEKELCQQAVIKEFFPDWKPLPRKEIKNNEEKGQVIQGKSDPNEWAKRLARMKELEKKAQEQTSKEEILRDDFSKESNVIRPIEDYSEDNLDYDEIDEILPGEKPVLSGPKVYVLLSMMGCITIGTWLYFVFSH